MKMACMSLLGGQGFVGNKSPIPLLSHPLSYKVAQNLLELLLRLCKPDIFHFKGDRKP